MLTKFVTELFTNSKTIFCSSICFCLSSIL